MGTAARIRNCRVRAGKSAREVAQQLGINDAWYDDLEQRDDELTSTLTLFQAIELASVLGVPLHELLGAEPSSDVSISLADLTASINEYVARNAISVDDFQDQVGWELRDFIQSPLKVAAESPITFIQALAERLGFDWLALVPGEHAPVSGHSKSFRLPNGRAR